MKVAQRVGTLLGLGGDRSAPPPQYAALADGLILTSTHVEAWFVLANANTDLMSVGDRDAQLDQADNAFGRVLAGYDCHLRVLWSPLRADDYLHEAGSIFTAGDWQAWAEMRVHRLEQMGMDTRHLLLGVRLTDRTGQARQAGARAAREALGTGTPPVSKRELATLSGQMRSLGRRLEMSPWRAEPAPVETLAWMIAREQHRTAPLPAPRDGAITGAKIATLTRGRIAPYPDHLRIAGADGTTAAWSTILTMPGFPPALDTPGGGEWLRVLSEITYVPPAREDDEGDVQPVPVSPEASVRFRVLPKRDALRKVDAARKSAKEQRRSASQQSAGEPGRDIEQTEREMEDLKVAISRDGVDLVDDHPRIIVTSTLSLDDLRARVDAVISHYAGADIEVVTGEDEQRELWCEMQPGDQVRVPDVGHTRDVTALSASWFWGGARVGDTDGPIIGYLTGSTPGVVRLDLTAGSDHGDSTTTAFLGRSGQGKSTAVAMCALDAAFRGAFVLILDFKGDLAGVVTAAKSYGLPARLVETTSQFAGSVDLFTLLEGHEAAQVQVPAQLTIAVPPHLRVRGAETPITRAVNDVIKSGEPSTWKVIEYLRRMDDALGRETGEALYDLAETGLGAPFMGRPAAGTHPLAPDPGVWVVQMPGLSLPDATTHQDDWHSLQRLSVALMHSMLAYGITTSGRRDLRGMRKMLAVPEVHVLTATRQGMAFLSYIARVGRALGTSLVLDTQDAVALSKIVGVVEQLRTVVGFQLTTEAEQDALAQLLGLPANQHTRAMIHAIGRLPSGKLRHGHSIIRDAGFNAATAQWDIPTAELLAMLDTSPKAAADADAAAAAHTETESVTA